MLLNTVKGAALGAAHSAASYAQSKMPSASSVSAVMNSAADQISQLKGVAQANNAWSANQARIQREWQEKQNAKAMEFNASEAAKNRDWQQLMSNTAHQREMKDLMAAGLNPVLSAMNGNGAAVTSGATASGVTSAGAKGEADTSTSGAIVNLLGSILAANTQIQAANVNARTQEAVADKYTAMEKIVADLNAAVSKYSADTSAAASRYASDAAKYSADQHLKGSYASAAAARYGADASKYAADKAYEAKRDFPSNSVSAAFSLFDKGKEAMSGYDVGKFDVEPGSLADGLLGLFGAMKDSFREATEKYRK